MQNMRTISTLLLLSVITAVFPALLLAQVGQDDEFERLLREEIEVEDPVYKPVLAFGIGSFGFMGDVTDFYSALWSSQPGYRLNVSTFLDRRRNYRLNFFMLYGRLTGNERSYLDLERNLNFQSEIINFGLNFEYTFNHIFRSSRWITPFVSAGIESFQFNSKADLLDDNGNPYNYWSDGTIRDIPENSPHAYQSNIIRRNYIYETDLRSANLYGMGNYPQIAFAVPVDYGLDFRITDRVNMRIGSSIHFTFTDMIDNISTGIAGIKSNSRNDRFSYSYVTFHLDLFSDPETIVVERLYADVEFDYTLVEDEDGDGVFDFWDLCPNTPPGVEVDEFGCPVDSDGDGVPDYLDLEPNTRPGALVDEFGREIPPGQLAEQLGQRENAVARDELDLAAIMPAYHYTARQFRSYDGIPEKFRPLDTDRDGFISFDELIRAINLFFDGRLDLTAEDIYELNDFFFSQ
ncbi:MAG: EF-hand domain-containing protein [Marinilabiliales bacterium]|nr:MAG: EF-hand domain-containing protein [Marinilabiliales bacterium]